MFFFMRRKKICVEKKWYMKFPYQNLCFFFYAIKKSMGNPLKKHIKIYVFFFTKNELGNPWKSPIKIYMFSLHKKNQWEIHGNPIKICVVLMRILKNGNPCIKISVFFCALS